MSIIKCIVISWDTDYHLHPDRQWMWPFRILNILIVDYFNVGQCKRYKNSVENWLDQAGILILSWLQDHVWSVSIYNQTEANNWNLLYKDQKIYIRHGAFLPTDQRAVQKNALLGKNYYINRNRVLLGRNERQWRKLNFYLQTIRTDNRI